MLVSEQESLESAMLEDKLRATDWESTEDAIQEQVARESYLCWLRDQQQQRQNGNSPTSASSTMTSTTTHTHATASSSAKTPPSPPLTRSSFDAKSAQFRAESEEQILARVLRESQCE